jgi:transcriptional regulator with XRE-family HTH domain
MKSQFFAEQLREYKEKMKVSVPQLAAFLQVKPVTVSKYLSGERSPRNEDTLLERLRTENPRAHDRCIQSFIERSKWTVQQVATQFNRYSGWKKITSNDIQDWLNNGLPVNKFETDLWKRSMGKRPATEAEYIISRFKQMESEVFALQYVLGKDGVWEKETSVQFNQRMAKGPERRKK